MSQHISNNVSNFHREECCQSKVNMVSSRIQKDQFSKFLMVIWLITNSVTFSVNLSKEPQWTCSDFLFPSLLLFLSLPICFSPLFQQLSACARQSTSHKAQKQLIVRFYGVIGRQPCPFYNNCSPMNELNKKGFLIGQFHSSRFPSITAVCASLAFVWAVTFPPSELLNVYWIEKQKPLHTAPR